MNVGLPNVLPGSGCDGWILGGLWEQNVWFCILLCFWMCWVDSGYALGTECVVLLYVFVGFEREKRGHQVG